MPTTPTTSGDRRTYWQFKKSDFFPTASFSSWSSYRSALSATIPRLSDRLLRRSTSSEELLSLPLRSRSPLLRCLSAADLALLSFGAVVGNGVFVLTGQESRLHAGPSIVLSYALAGASALISALIYADLASDLPSAGGALSYLRVELGDFVAFLAAANIVLQYLVGAAGIARSWTSYFATVLGRSPDDLRILAPALAEGFDLLDPIAVVVLLVCNGVAVVGTRHTSFLNGASSVVSMVVIAFIVVAGAVHAEVANLTPFFPFGVKGTVQGAAVLFWAYTGFDVVATMAEETKNPGRDIPVGLIGSMLAITVVYCAMALVLVMMQPYYLVDTDAAFSVAFESVGMKWAKFLVAFGALKGMTTGLLVGGLGQARYSTQIARAHMIPPFFALVHPKTNTPIYATMLIAICSACIAFFSSLDVLVSVSSISNLLIFGLVAVALLVRRYYVREVTPKENLFKLWVFLLLIVGSSIGISAYWNSNQDGWIGYVIAVPLWFVSTLGLSVFVPQQRVPKVWGAPLVPWLPPLSIVINLLLIGSLGYQAFARFGICTLVMLFYYVFIGVHATYDIAHQEQDELQAAKVEATSTVDGLEQRLIDGENRH